MSVRSPLMTVMINAVQKTAKTLIRDFGEVENLQVSRKGPSDFVTNADLAAEKMLRAELLKARPAYGFLMEESGVVEGEDSSNRWIIDPIDGTTNFLHGLPQWCISLALERDGDVHAGVIYDPIKDELFWGERGAGAFLNNNRRLRVTSRNRLDDCLVATDVPGLGRGNHAGLLADLQKVMGQVAGIRRLGSAALDLAYVAAGRLDAYYEREIKPWDIAAGVLLVREAGGFVTDLQGGKKVLGSTNILAANQAIHGAMLALVGTR
jgi:myo-inositol-1(or 4)-monophosphatase